MSKYTGRRAILDNIEITSADRDVEELLNCNERAIAHFNLRRGDEITIETVEVTIKTAMVKEHRYGFDGLKREQVVERDETLVATETRKLWKTKARGWYWK